MRKIALGLTAITLILAVLLYFAIKEAKNLHRDPKVLMDRYYLLKDSHPDAAQEALKVILRQDANYLPALTELAKRNPNPPPELSFLPYYKIGPQVTETGALPSVSDMLMQRFYQLKKENSKEAAQLLSAIDLITTDKITIPEELGYIALQNHQIPQAINYFSRAFATAPSPQLALQLAYLYSSQGNRTEASSWFLLATLSEDPVARLAAQKGYQMSALTQTITPTPTGTPESLLLDKFYALKKTNPNQAWQLIQIIIKKYPHNITALKEGGFLGIDRKQPLMAIDYFTQAYVLNQDPELAMQIGYLYNQINTDNQSVAYHYFTLATLSTDKILNLKAQNALTNLSGLQTKRLPAPFFGEVFFDPFTQNRFGLTVRPFIARLGIENNNRFQTKTYLVLRQTQDNKSVNTGQVPQIYEDNVRVTGLGFQASPFPPFPLVAFVEAGRAYDLVYRNRDRWRNDLRGGFMYYNEFGKQPAYYDSFKLSMDYYSTLYGDITYFSRYNNNVIATLKTHQGIRLAQYKSSMLNLYITGRMIEDTNRDFFNNIAEIGPGIGFVPSNRYKMELRLEAIRGRYLPAGDSVNPYGTYYTNTTIQLFLYIKV